MKKFFAIVLTLAMMLSLAACAKPATPQEPAAPQEDATVEKSYAVESGSAGEAVANEKGFKTNAVADQATALMEVQSGNSDCAIVDLLMAAAMVGEGTSYPELTFGEKLTTEEYGVGCRKGSDLAEFINSVFYEAYQNGKMKEIAAKYKLDDKLMEMPEVQYTESAEGDVADIKAKGELIVGITEFEPMDYLDKNGEWIGFDADMAKLVAEKLGVDVKFQIIEWNNKIFELDGKTIDVVWNGMTLTDEVKGGMECTVPYFENAQVVVSK